jgi:1-pyrroline-5-carboxylate dehydrogenase
MLGIRRGAVYFYRRFSTSPCVSGLENYKAVNEPILEYLPGSKERIELDAKLKEYDSKVHEVPIVIGDEELTNSDVRYQVRPFDHQNKLAKFYYADRGMLEKAIDVSQKAHHDWERRPQEERSEIFLRAADLIAGKYRMDLMASTMLGQGKTIIQGEIDTACELADFYRFNVQYIADLVKFQPISVENTDNSMIYRGMEGFWAAIAPFNFTAISGHLAGAPAFMGNTVLWKSSDTSMLSSYICFKILREAGVPPGVINFVPADGPVFGDVITKSPHLAGINFTGSARTFHLLWQEVAKNIGIYNSYPRLIGECGGKNFHFVHTTADAQSVVYGSLRSAFEYSGQKCSACSRMYVAESKWDEIREGLIEEHKKIKMGSVLEPDSFLSAVIDDKAFDRIKSYVDHAKSSPNVKVIAGGNCDNSKGYYIEPTIVQASDPKDRIMQEEIFGPVLGVYVYPDNEYKQTLELINSTSPYALTGAVYAQDPSVVDEAADILRYASGNFYINDKSTGSVVAQQPFGGARKSGTNDKAGGPHYLLKFASPQAIKQTKVHARELTYKYMDQ